MCNIAGTTFENKYYILLEFQILYIISVIFEMFQEQRLNIILFKLDF
jgi:hypothetical protein